MIIGIDMGTTNSAVASANNDGDVEAFTFNDGKRTMPSTVYFDGSRLLVGNPHSEEEISAANQFHGIKRLLGRKARSTEITRLARAASYQIAASPVGDCWVRINNRPTPPQKLAGAILRTLRLQAESALGYPVTRAVIAVPAYFDDAQRQAVRDAGQIAGLDVVRLINEPTAAALAYGVSKQSEPTTVAVFDLGGGTFDISILRVANDVFTVLSSHGDASLGGDDWDQRIVELLIDEIFTTYRFDATSCPQALKTLRTAAERAKVELSTQSSTSIHFTLDSNATNTTMEISRRLSRRQLDELTADLCERLSSPCTLALADAELSSDDIDSVLLVGGMTQAPMIRQAAGRLLGTHIKPFATDPSTAVALGAAICGAVLNGSDSPTTLLDVTSHSLGVRVADIDLPLIIERGEELPARKTLHVEIPHELEFTDGLTVELFRGESTDLSTNTLVGRVLLDLPKAEGAAPGRIELSITVDVNSIVAVHARDLDTGNIAQTRLRTRGSLSKSQLVRIVESDVIAAITEYSS